jgi:DNA-binding response OmpR family regulator
MQTILVIDDDEYLRDTIGVMPEKEGYRSVLVGNGKSGLEQARLLIPSLILLDLRLPGISGAEVCKQIRSSDRRIPIIVISAAGDEIDKVLLFEIGADDYVVKPFGTRELLARIRAVLRRVALDIVNTVSFSEVEVDLEHRIVKRRGEDVTLTRAEYNLLMFFFQNPNKALTRATILKSVWGYEWDGESRTVDIHVTRLRKKLEQDFNCPKHFVTVHGVGYRFLPRGVESFS